MEFHDDFIAFETFIFLVVQIPFVTFICLVVQIPIRILFIGQPHVDTRTEVATCHVSEGSSNPETTILPSHTRPSSPISASTERGLWQDSDR